MKEVSLSSGKYPGLVAMVDDEDYGAVIVHTWWPSHVDGKMRPGSFYAYMQTDRKTIFLHNFICEIHGLPVSPDHANRNGLDNRKENLRIRPSRAQQEANKELRSDNKSGFKGVSWNSRAGKWRAVTYLDRRQIHLGSFGDPEEAAHAYDKAAIEHFGEFAVLNFPDEMETEVV